MVVVMKLRKLLYTTSSQYGNYRVVEMMYNGRPSRLLFGDDASPQSGIALDDDSEALFDYNQRFMEIVVSLQPRKILVIGGGAFSLPVAIIERFPDVTIDVVEIDPVLPDIARQFFDLRDQPGLNIIIQDGRDILNQSRGDYDLIVVDAFSGMDIPRQLLSVQAARQYQKNLAPEGVMALNFISAYHVANPQLAHRLQATFDPVFSSVELYPSEGDGRVKDSDNIVLVASDKLVPSLDYLQSSSLSRLVGMRAEVINDI